VPTRTEVVGACGAAAEGALLDDVVDDVELLDEAVVLADEAVVLPVAEPVVEFGESVNGCAVAPPGDVPLGLTMPVPAGPLMAPFVVEIPEFSCTAVCS
jgi:hypothetical protein